MQIAWLGQYTVKIATKDVVIVLDPYAPNVGLSPFRSKATIAGLTNPKDPSMSHLGGVIGQATIIDTPGEYSLSGTVLHSFGWQDNQGNERSIMRWIIEGMTLLHVGALDRKLTEAELADINRTDIDILLVPVGGGTGLTTKGALDLVATVEPRMVIPIHFRLAGLTEKLEPVSQFAKEMGVSEKQAEKKIVLRPSRLPHEDMETVLLLP